MKLTVKNDKIVIYLKNDRANSNTFNNIIAMLKNRYNMGNVKQVTRELKKISLNVKTLKTVKFDSFKKEGKTTILLSEITY